MIALFTAVFWIVVLLAATVAFVIQHWWAFASVAGGGVFAFWLERRLGSSWPVALYIPFALTVGLYVATAQKEESFQEWTSRLSANAVDMRAPAPTAPVKSSDPGIWHVPKGARTLILGKLGEIPPFAYKEATWLPSLVHVELDGRNGLMDVALAGINQTVWVFSGRIGCIGRVTVFGNRHMVVGLPSDIVHFRPLDTPRWSRSDADAMPEKLGALLGGKPEVLIRYDTGPQVQVDGKASRSIPCESERVSERVDLRKVRDEDIVRAADDTAVLIRAP